MESLGVSLAYLLDLIFGDPEWFPHPVRGIGRLINILDNKLRGNSSKKKEQIKGVILVFIVVGISIFFAWLFITLSIKLNLWFGGLVWIYLGYTTLSIKDLSLKAKAISQKVQEDSLIEARHKLSRIVGRDTQNLDKDKIIIATIESIAENTNDGIVAPLFYLILGGPVLAIAYKAINTLDSMIGHKNERYLDFGRFPARVDDVANFIPALITGFLISISAFISGKSIKHSLKIMLRDGKKHPSPNSGISEAAMAGSLGIKLGGDSFYGGRLFTKPYLGEGRRVVTVSLISQARRISLIASILMLIIGVGFRWIV